MHQRPRRLPQPAPQLRWEGWTIDWVTVSLACGTLGCLSFAFHTTPSEDWDNEKLHGIIFHPEMQSPSPLYMAPINAWRRRQWALDDVHNNLWSELPNRDYARDAYTHQYAPLVAAVTMRSTLVVRRAMGNPWWQSMICSPAAADYPHHYAQQYWRAAPTQRMAGPHRPANTTWLSQHGQHGPYEEPVLLSADARYLSHAGRTPATWLARAT